MSDPNVYSGGARLLHAALFAGLLKLGSLLRFVSNAVMLGLSLWGWRAMR